MSAVTAAKTHCYSSVRIAAMPGTRIAQGGLLASLPRCRTPVRCVATRASDHPFKVPPWRPGSVLDEWAERDIRPVSLRQLLFFGRALTEARLLSAANYVRTELPTRIAHRLREMQSLPYVVVTNPRLSHVYELYYSAFERFRKVPEIRTLEDNDRYCEVLKKTLREHLTAIPSLMMGVLECEHLIDPDEMDAFMNRLLRARISRRVIAEQHIALTETYSSPWHFPGDAYRPDITETESADSDSISDSDYVGEILLRCNTKRIVDTCGSLTRQFFIRELGTDHCVPEIVVRGHLDATFPYIQSHLEYVLGELLRNSVQAVATRYRDSRDKPPPIEVLICESSQHVIIRVSDQGGGIPREMLPSLWSFCKGPSNGTRLQNLEKVPTMAATMQELQLGGTAGLHCSHHAKHWHSSLSTLTFRPPNLRLGMSLPMSRVFAEYWAGSLELHSLEGYGVDAFFQISKLGNKNEQLTTRASVDAV